MEIFPLFLKSKVFFHLCSVFFIWKRKKMLWGVGVWSSFFFSVRFQIAKREDFFFFFFFFLNSLDDDDYQEKKDNKFVCFMKQRKRKIKQQRQKILMRSKENEWESFPFWFRTLLFIPFSISCVRSLEKEEKNMQRSLSESKKQWDDKRQKRTRKLKVAFEKFFSILFFMLVLLLFGFFFLFFLKQKTKKREGRRDTKQKGG